jgi:transcriptional regulator with XRE-family HTH domain
MQGIEYESWRWTPLDSFGQFLEMELKLRRIRAGLRQHRVAQELNMPPLTLCDYENGRKPVPPRQVQRILAAIDRLSISGGLKEGANGCA